MSRPGSKPPAGLDVTSFLRTHGLPAGREGLRLFFFTLGVEAARMAFNEADPGELLEAVRDGLATAEARQAGTVV